MNDKKHIVFMIILFLILSGLKVYTQNLVPNGGFEIYKQHPTDHSMIDKASYWKTNLKLGADYYHVDSYTPEYSNKTPFKGEGYAGIFVLHTRKFSEENNSEYISTILNSKLIKNQKYYIEFYVYISHTHNLHGLFSINNISAVFTTDSIEGLNSKKNEEIIKKSQTRFDNTSINISIKNKWIKISGNFTAKGGEQYMTIGNFDLLENMVYVRTDGKSKKIKLDKLSDVKRLYFYIDEIKVVPIDSNGNEIKWKKDSVEITNHFVKNKSYQINNIHFETGSSTIKNESYQELDNLFEQLKKIISPTDTIVISGHTDDIGKEEDNLKLSENRAKAVAEYLIKKGLQKENIKFVGYGSSKPIADNETGQGREQNRRVELFIKKNKK